MKTPIKQRKHSVKNLNNRQDQVKERMKRAFEIPEAPLRGSLCASVKGKRKVKNVENLLNDVIPDTFPNLGENRDITM